MTFQIFPDKHLIEVEQLSILYWRVDIDLASLGKDKENAVDAFHNFFNRVQYRKYVEFWSLNLNKCSEQFEQCKKRIHVRNLYPVSATTFYNILLRIPILSRNIGYFSYEGEENPKPI